MDINSFIWERKIRFVNVFCLEIVRIPLTKSFVATEFVKEIIYSKFTSLFQ